MVFKLDVALAERFLTSLPLSSLEKEAATAEQFRHNVEVSQSQGCSLI